MTPGLTTWRCRSCGASYFPERLICPVCGGAQFDTVTAHDGRVEEITIVSHVIGQESWSPRPIATVLLAEGPRVLAGTLGEIASGAAVKVFSEDLVPYVQIVHWPGEFPAAEASPLSPGQ
jgi:uncharacterized OB-fold protein